MLSACMGQVSPSNTNTVKEGIKNNDAPDATPVILNIPIASSPLVSAGDIAQSRFGARALSYLEQNGGRYGIVSASGELVYLNESIDNLQQKHVRFQQVIKGIPVRGRQLVVHFNERDEVVSVTGAFLSGLGQIDVRPRVSAITVAATAASFKGEGWRATDTVLCIYPHGAHPLLAYHITLTRGLERWFVFVDARDGTVLHQITGMPTAAP